MGTKVFRLIHSNITNNTILGQNGIMNYRVKKRRQLLFPVKKENKLENLS